MRKTVYLFATIACSVMLSSYTQTRPSMLGKAIPDFSLLNTDGRMVSLSSYPHARGFIIVFSCNHCPFAKLYTSRLNELNRQYKPKGVPLLVINSMDTAVYEEESFAAMKTIAKTEKYSFPYLRDAAQNVVKSLQASHTPQAYLLWREQGKWIVKYSGAIDDNGKEAEKAKSYIAKAVNELLQGKPVSIPETKSFGCGIHYR